HAVPHGPRTKSLSLAATQAADSRTTLRRQLWRLGRRALAGRCERQTSLRVQPAPLDPEVPRAHVGESYAMKSWRQTSILLFFAGLLFFPPNGSSCGPFFPEAIFVFQEHPGAPLKQYAEGSLGVVLPSYTRSYLVIAYRVFSGHPLAADEVKG